MLKIGDKAPDFTLPDMDENLTSLNKFLGKKIVLWFFPKASTPGWIMEGNGFRSEFNEKICNTEDQVTLTFWRKLCDSEIRKKSMQLWNTHESYVVLKFARKLCNYAIHNEAMEV